MKNPAGGGIVFLTQLTLKLSSDTGFRSWFFNRPWIQTGLRVFIRKKLIDTDFTSVLQDLDLNFSGRFGYLDIGKEVSLSTNF
jgi:hypothetical protein